MFQTCNSYVIAHISIIVNSDISQFYCAFQNCSLCLQWLTEVVSAQSTCRVTVHTTLVHHPMAQVCEQNIIFIDLFIASLCNSKCCHLCSLSLCSKVQALCYRVLCESATVMHKCWIDVVLSDLVYKQQDFVLQ